MSSASLNPSDTGRSSYVREICWLLKTIIASVVASMLRNPSFALLMRFSCSQLKGIVTTPIVRCPFSFAVFAITGAAPVPVPPPIPAMTNTMLPSPNRDEISSMLSSAAAFPFFELAPQPLPLHKFSPSVILQGTSERFRSWKSVLQIA